MTDQGASIRQLYDVVFIIAAVIFFVVEGLILWTVLRYRRRPGDDELPPQTHGNALAEALWTIIPTIIVAFLFVISWQTLNGVEALSASPELKVRAYAAQFQWQFDYYDESGENIVFTQLVPQGEGGGMALPVGQDVRLVLESRDVIHAYYVPQFLFQAGRRARPRQRVRHHDQARGRGQDVRRAVRRAVRCGSSPHDLRGPRHDSGRVRRLAPGAHRPGTAPASVRGAWRVGRARRVRRAGRAG